MREALRKLRKKRNSEKRLIANIAKEIKKLKKLNAKLLIRNLGENKLLSDLSEAEFSVYSQFGEDGIIQYLLQRISDIPRSFIEFGVADYTEANTRFLLENNNWRGLILDCDAAAMVAIRSDDLFWMHDLTAAGAFVDCENINRLFLTNGFTGDIGLLSIDIDGNDYWVWNSIEAVRPKIVIVEYNSVFGPDIQVTVPYDPSFTRRKAHSSMLYWGCSLNALCTLASKKGYSFVGSESSGVNAFFVRTDSIEQLRPLSSTEGYNRSRIRQSRDDQNNLTFLSFEQSQQAIKDLPLYDLLGEGMSSLSQLLEI